MPGIIRIFDRDEQRLKRSLSVFPKTASRDGAAKRIMLQCNMDCAEGRPLA